MSISGRAVRPGSGIAAARADHFPSKADLGTRLISRYEENFLRALASIDATLKDAKHKLREYARIYETVLHHERMCLCGMLAAEHATLLLERSAPRQVRPSTGRQARARDAAGTPHPGQASATGPRVSTDALPRPCMRWPRL